MGEFNGQVDTQKNGKVSGGKKVLLYIIRRVNILQENCNENMLRNE